MLTNRRQVDAIEIRPRMADGGRVRKACAGRRRERRARVLRQDARLLDHGGKSLRVPSRRRRAWRAGRTASQCRRAIHPSSREPQPGTATRIGFAPRTVSWQAVPDPSRPGLTRASIAKKRFNRKEALQSKRFCWVISAFTRVFRRAMPGNDGTASYHTASRSFTAPSRSTETSCDTPRSAMVTP
jgi:hypothetical protein